MPRGRIDRIRKSRPLQPVARTFGETGIAAGLVCVVDFRIALFGRHDPGDVALPAADFDGVGRDDPTYLMRQIAQRNAARFGTSRIEIEVPEVDPCAAAHRLVDAETGRSSFVANRVDRIVRAVRQCFIGDVNGIPAAFRNVGRPTCRADVVRMTYGHGLPERSVAERVLGVLVAGLFVGEAGLLAGRPGFRPVSLFVTRRARYRRVVVCDRLFGLYVAFARHQDVGPGVFQHRNQVGQHVALRVEVFDDLENTCPLPLPAVQFRFEIVSVTLPQGDVASVESGGRPVGPIRPRDQRLGRFRDEAFPAAVGFAAQRGGDQFLDPFSVGEQDDLLAFEPGRQQFSDTVVNSPDVVFAERDVGAVLAGIEFQRFFVCGHRVDRNPARADRRAGRFGEQVPDPVADILRERLGLQRQSCREEPRQQERKTDCVRFFYDFHFFLISRQRPANVNNALNIKSS